MTWTAMIVDDEPYVREDLRQMLRAHPEIDVACEAGTVAQARKQLADHRPDLIFLDIQLRGGTGFDLVPDITPDTRIVFITAYDRYAVRAFKINALDYILKPVTPERLAESLRRLDPETPSPAPGPLTPDDKVFIKSDDGLSFVPVHAITAVGSIGGNYMAVSTASGENLVCRRTIKEWLDILPEELFVRIHRSTLVNIRHVDRFEAPKRGTGLVFMAGRIDPLAVSVRMAATLKKRLSALARSASAHRGSAG
jgi:two-component system LytT family response regulator